MPPSAARPMVERPFLARLPGLFAQARNTLNRIRHRLIWPKPPGPVFHITHHKAGSQWIRRILEELSGPWIVPPRSDGGQFLHEPIRARSVYPTLYLTREQFESVSLPPRTRRFVVIRDLRDTLISAYFSLKISHDPIDSRMAAYRAALQKWSQEEGLTRMIREICSPIAALQRSWLNGPAEIIKYEDLLDRDEEILGRILLEEYQFPVSRDHFTRVVAANRFAARTGGRKPGMEDVASHERKGIAGDWRNHFTDRIARAFKEHYGDLLIATGYERDLNW